MPARQPLAHLVTMPLTEIPSLCLRDKLRLAASPETPQAVLELLLRDPYIDVRIELATRRQASDALLRELARDSALPVRKRLAYRAMLPKDVVAMLLADPSRLVRTEVLLRHPLKAGSTDPESASAAERRLAAASQGITLEQARRFACDPDWSVRRLVLRHVGGPEWLEIVALVALSPELCIEFDSWRVVERLLLELAGETPPEKVPTGAISALTRNRDPVWRALGRKLAYRRHAARSGHVRGAPTSVGAPLLAGLEKLLADDALPGNPGRQQLPTR